VVQQSLRSFDEISDLQTNVIYQRQFFNGKIISAPKYQILDLPITAETVSTAEITTLAEAIYFANDNCDFTYYHYGKN